MTKIAGTPAQIILSGSRTRRTRRCPSSSARWLFITSDEQNHESLKPLISMWLSIAATSLLAMGESGPYGPLTRRYIPTAATPCRDHSDSANKFLSNLIAGYCSAGRRVDRQNLLNQ
ncbi:TPA: type IV secretion system DNA-binding domain-containing protein [Salmonella enterica]|nr:type IV secretion system DNA-binding domain-containing protein [Salmonella enterica]HCB4567661.1 type IV secretion system DNA-binding domain-containing protein [Salmonella enterica]